ncbi:Cell adhesion molecule 2 [Frankliniella fusca]|uniref:Cell adhesion molecule 2 n=1 Tax=Frankliniella fusca TaxID=407009 RepID=A0AAE1LEM1_9NEOP|nr:Cell adhesion molecule 2 [Frankliniella fusca]
MKFLTVCSLFLWPAGAVAPLKDARLHIPKAVKRHEDAVLRCEYDMEGDRLYQIKWYKSQHEFFRFTPGEESPIKVFAVKGITVDKDRSNNRQVTLHKVEMSAEGRYACEVSADMPSFATSVIEDFLTVVEVPRRAPNLSGLQARYKIGDLLRANCTSDPSHPPANLTISINGQQVRIDTAKR